MTIHDRAEQLAEKLQACDENGYSPSEQESYSLIVDALRDQLEDAAKVCEEWAAHYPPDIFVPLDKAGEHNDGSDTWTARVSAEMGRHSSKQIAAALRRMKEEG